MFFGRKTVEGDNWQSGRLLGDTITVGRQEGRLITNGKTQWVWPENGTEYLEEDTWKKGELRKNTQKNEVLPSWEGGERCAGPPLQSIDNYLIDNKMRYIK